MPVRAWDPTPYPDARKRAQFGGEAAAVETVTIPRTAVWSFIVDTSGDLQIQTVVSRRFVGPVFLKQALLEMNPGNSGTGQAVFSLRWATDDSGNGAGVANGQFPAGSPIFDSNYSSPVAIPPYRADSMLRTPQTIVRPFAGAILLDRYIDAGEVFLKASVFCAIAGVQSFSGVITLYEQVDPQTLLDLMG